MAVTLITHIKKYYGLSTDTKPTASDVVKGSVFEETNTGYRFKYNGSAWNFNPRTDEQ